jgi:hypothetical protein
MVSAFQMIVQDSLRFGNTIADQEEIVIRHYILHRARYRERGGERW